MPAPLYTAADYLTALQGLMPRGRIWPRDPDATQTKALSGLTAAPERVNARAADLLVDAFPASTLELLPDWEQSLGLPDPCAGLSPTIEQRRAQVVSRFIATGGQSVPYYATVALALGYAITITEFAPFRCGMTCGLPLCGDAWAHTWQVNAPTFTINYFECGTSVCGEPLASWGNTVLQCEIQRLKPAHTTVLFNYS